jgi:Anti-sigma-K factor rskA/Putative zinc-finger
MTTPLHSCDRLDELLGAFALDALEEDEAVAVRAHLIRCPRCTQEVDAHQETIGLLAAGGGDAPERVWDRIANTVEDFPGSTHIGMRRGQHLTPAPFTRRWPVRTLLVAAGAAAAIAISAQTIRVNHLNDRVSQLGVAARQEGVLEGAAAAVLNPSAQRLPLASTQGGRLPLGQLVILPNGSAYLVGAALPTLPATATYQLWSIVAGRPVSVALLGPQPGTVGFNVAPRFSATAYLVTIEPSGGVITPSSSPVAAANA